VSRTIWQFENDALIGIASTRHIILRDRAALTSIAAYDNSTESYRHTTRGHNQICSLNAETVD
jgi:hypothetical protein